MGEIADNLLDMYNRGAIYIDSNGILRPKEENPQTQSEETACIVIRLDSVTPQKTDWAWQGYIPLGKITLIDGDPGVSKSLFTLEVVARITTGRPMPDGSQGIEAGAVLLNLEDGLADTIVPRLEVAGGDRTKVVALQGVKDSEGKPRFPTVEDVEAIAEACKKVQARIVIIDPLMGYLGGRVNSWRDQDIRQALSPIVKMTEELNIATIIVRHLNKSGQTQSIYRGGGSIGIIGAARSALLIGKDPQDDSRRVLAGMKSNLAPLPPSLSYTIENHSGIPKIIWGGVSSHTADALLAIPSSQEERSSLEEAQEFLKGILSEGPVEVKEIERNARHAGIAERTLQRAKKVLGVISKRDIFGKDGRWFWALDCQNMPKVANKNIGDLRGDLATLGGEGQATGREVNLLEGEL